MSVSIHVNLNRSQNESHALFTKALYKLEGLNSQLNIFILNEKLNENQ